MKITELSFKELLEAKHEPENLRPIAEAYWRVMLVVAMIGVGGVIAFGIWEFRAVLGKITTQADVTNAPNTSVLDRAQLGQVIQRFESRKADYQTHSSTPVPAADPSVK